MPSNFLTQLIERASDIIFPSRCPFCDEVVPIGAEVCGKCEKTVFDEELFSAQKSMFGAAFRRTNNLSGYVSCYKYTGAAARGIVMLKSDPRYCAGKFFVSKMLGALSGEAAEKADVVTFVPADKRRKGRELSKYLASLVAKGIKKPCMSLLVKTRTTESQHTLGLSGRISNLKGAFASSAPLDFLAGKTVLICDDVITSGTTLNECAGALKRAGARNVYALTIAATPRRRFTRTDARKRKAT